MKLIGKRGQINVNGDQCTAVITSPILEKKYGSLVTFDSKDLHKWIERLQIYQTEDGSIQLGNWQ